MQRLIIVIGLLLFSVLGALAALSYSRQPPLAELATSYRYPPPRPLPPFALTDQRGQAFTNDRLKGQWSLIFVGYTSCPDICPTNLSKLTAVYQQLKDDIPLQVILLSVDPARDTPEKLTEYIDFFNPDFIAVTAPHDRLLPFTRALGFVYAMVGDGDNYRVDHSATMVLIAPDGTRIATIKPTAGAKMALPGITAPNLIHDIRAIAAHYGA